MDFTFTIEPQDMVTVRGSVLQLDCQAHSDALERPLTIAWRKDGVLLSAVVDERRRQLGNGSLLVQNVVHSRHHRPDEGEYQCIATLDGLGSIVSRTARITVAGKKVLLLYTISGLTFTQYVFLTAQTMYNWGNCGLLGRVGCP